MAQSFAVELNPALLTWARETGGYSLDRAAAEIGIPSAELTTWEKGKAQPTWAVLCKLAKLYHRPVASLLLPAPPPEPPLPPDFRTLQSSRRALSPQTRFVIRTARWLVRTAANLEQQIGSQQPASLPSATLQTDPESLAERVRERLVIGVEEQARWKDDAQALQRWRRAVEQHQVFVFQFRLSLDEARGFSLVEQARPAIVLNRTDIPSARSFTLFHELGHVLLSQPGICLPAEGGIGRGKSVETFCNQFAAALLVPTIDLEQHIPKALDESNFRALARRYAVSRLVVLGRLRSLGIVSAAVYGRFSSQWNKRRHESLPDSRPTRRGPTAAQRCLFERGQPFVSLVLAAAKRELITLNDAMTYLGTKVQGYRELTERA